MQSKNPDLEAHNIYQLMRLILGEYLLHENLPRELIDECLAQVAHSNHAGRLRRSGLEPKLPDVIDDEVRNKLIFLLLAFSGDLNHTLDVISTMRFVSEMHRVIDAYLDGKINRNEFIFDYEKTRDIYRSEIISYLMSTMAFELSSAIFKEGDPYRSTNLDVARVCILTKQKLRSYWNAVIFDGTL